MRPTRAFRRRLPENNWRLYRAAALAIALVTTGLALESGRDLMAQPVETSPAPDFPPAATLEAGDFLWPKLPNKVVPYNSAPGQATEADRVQWESERLAELYRIGHLSAPSAEEGQRYTQLSTLSYAKFTSSYLANEPIGTIVPYGAIARVGVGHVAIVSFKDGVPWVIEAMVQPGVREISYVNWLRARPGEKVWHGRLRGVSGEGRARIAKEAASELGKPYRFWNFDLGDSTGFYCSKLAWLSVFRATGKSLDVNPSPKRSLWFSPKQMLRSPLLEVISSPGPY